MAKILTLDQLRDEDWRIRDIFFESSLAGYASEHPPETIELALFPHSKHIEYENGLWRVTDTWDDYSESDYTDGKTTVYYRDVPVWVMHYYGQYPKSAIPILKAALQSAHQERIFWGGRGPNEYAHPDGKYLNFLDPHARSFRSFRGTEIVLVTKTDETGSHFFHGGMMI